MTDGLPGDGDMTDEEYIRAGVDLAEGWHWNEYSDTDEVDLSDADGAAWYDDECDPITPHAFPRILLDAVAAQLWRQVDERPDEIACVADYGWAKVIRFQDAEPFNHWVQLSLVKGENRSWNVLKAIVDSGVLISEGGTMQTGRGKPGHSPVQGERDG